MALQFILGTAGMDHQQEVVNQIKQQPTQTSAFYLVPNHIKFESEVQVLKHLQENQQETVATSQLQVLSFSRLAWYFLRNHPVYQKQRISATGTNMAIYQIIIDRQADLYLFDQEIHQVGFTEQIAKQITEMQNGNVLPVDLQQLLAGQQLSNDLSDKLHDFVIVYEEYLTRITDRFYDETNILRLLTEYLQTIDLSETDFYIDGFSRFTAVELQLVQTLTQCAHKVVVSLILDHPYPVELPDTTSLFYQPAKTFWQLYHFASDNQIPYLAPITATTPRICPPLMALEQYWITSNTLNAELPASQSLGEEVQVFQADNRYSELMQVATRIRQAVASGKYRYSDVLILTRHLDQYQQFLTPVMNLNSIPFFEDQQKTMADHPLVELISALFAVQTPDKNRRSYRYPDMMRLLKSELLIPVVDGQSMPLEQFRRSVALTENLILKNGYEGYAWLQKEDWPYGTAQTNNDELVVTSKDQALSEQVNQIRHFIQAILPPFYRKLFKARTNRDAAAILYNFLEANGVLSQLEGWRQTAVDDGNITQANEIEQVVNNLNSLLDEEVMILGEQPFVFDDFWQLLLTGFQNAKYSAIPSTLDQVRISESGIVQTSNRKITFMIGSTDNNMPAQLTNDQLFGDDDLVQLQEQLTDSQYLGDDSGLQMAGEPYLNYLAFTSSSQQLIFSYCPQDDEEGSAVISPYVSRIQSFFKIQTQHAPAIPTASEDILSYLGTARATLHHLIQVIQAAYAKDKPLPTAWQMVYQKLRHQPQTADLTAKLLRSIDYQNVPAQLNPDIVTGLYGQAIDTSISQLELFYRNPYEYYLRYGLRLQEREVFDLSTQSTGQFFHEALDRVVKITNANQQELTELSDTEIANLVKQVVNEIIHDPSQLQYVILTSSARMQYLTNQLTQTVIQMVQTMRRQGQLTPMRPKQTELIFGQAGPNTLKGLDFTLPEKREVHVRGRIDRIDSIKVDNQSYYGVVDYKSGDKTFDYAQAYDGTSMQLLTYLDVLRKNLDLITDDEEALLAGALYLHVYNPRFTTEKLRKADYDLEKALLEAHTYKGLIVDDAPLVDEMTKEVEPGQKSLVYPLNRLAKGTIAKKNTLINPSDLNAFLLHNEDLIKSAAQRIFAGDNSLMPVKYGPNDTAMQFTPYKAIMNFDPLLPQNNYRVPTKLTVKEVLDSLRGQQ